MAGERSKVAGRLLAGWLAATAPAFAGGTLVMGGGDPDPRIDLAMRLWGWTVQQSTGTGAPGGDFFSLGNSRYENVGPGTAMSDPSHAVGYGVMVMEGFLGEGGATMPRISFHSERLTSTGKVAATAGLDVIPRTLQDALGDKVPATTNTMWGFSHGQYSSVDMFLPYIDQLLKSGRPGKAPEIAAGWLADVNSSGDTATATFPYVAAYADFQGDRSKCTWLPNRYMAYVWRAYNSRDPVKTKVAAPSENGLFDQPDLRITKPVMHWTHDYYQQYVDAMSTDSVYDFEARTAKLADAITRVDIYDGDVQVGGTPANFLGLYRTKIHLNKQGLHTLICIAALKSGKSFTSRPALAFVFGPDRPYRGPTVGLGRPARFAPAGSAAGLVFLHALGAMAPGQAVDPVGRARDLASPAAPAGIYFPAKP